MPAINIWAVLAAILASGALGALWYSPVLFLRPWVRAAGREPKQDPMVYAVTLVSAVLAAVGFAVWLGPHPSLGSALSHGLLAGICFAASSLGLNYAFANRGLVLWLIDGGFHVARFVLIGLVLGLWP
ncbi:MAG: hypothetical protein JWN86_1469 [Planctomycetota bacterium]|nr:hypothetical protein [Planctomycetota bacterium]